MLSAIRELAEKTGSQSHSATADYLEACNQIFEQGILSHSKVTHHESHVLLNLKRGFTFSLCINIFVKPPQVYIIHNVIHYVFGGIIILLQISLHS